MIKSLSALLEEGEVLHTPIFAVAEKIGQKKLRAPCFVGLTESVLLVALLNVSATQIEWTTRVPLEMEALEVKRSLLLKQFIIKIMFSEGEEVQIRVSRKVLLGDFGNQEANLAGFVERLCVHE